MKHSYYTQMAQSMKENDMDIESLTKTVNTFASEKGFHVCEQEMMNYLLKNEPIPRALEYILDTIFNFQDEQGGLIAHGQMSLGLEVEYEI